MFDRQAFRAEVVRKGKTMKGVANALGINVSTLYRKMNGQSDFYLDEIQALLLYLEIQEPKGIFFAHDIT